LGFKLSQIGDPKNQNKKSMAIHTKDFCGKEKKKKKLPKSPDFEELFFLNHHI
jgi:hypothetical protein